MCRGAFGNVCWWCCLGVCRWLLSFLETFRRKHLRLAPSKDSRPTTPRGTHNEQEKCDNSWFYSIQSRWKSCGLTSSRPFYSMLTRWEEQMFPSMIGKSLFGVDSEGWEGIGIDTWERCEDEAMLSCWLHTHVRHYTTISLLLLYYCH
jgi:hypothetical protein